jgi:pyruvate dehydrogenase E2 component (dihydrolipoamide acetyltransferase)
VTAAFAPGGEPLPFALLRTAAELFAETGYFLGPTGPLRFFLRGPRDAPALLLLHGMGDTAPGWLSALPLLSRRYRVHALDLPGHGLSADPPDWRLPTMLSAVRAYARTLDRPLVVGHSLGGWLGARLVLEGQVETRGLVLVNPAGAGLSRETWTEFSAVVSARDARGAREYLRRAFHRPPPLLWAFPGEVVKVMNAPNALGLLAALSEPDFLTGDELSRLRGPLRLVWGERDRFLPERSFAFFRDHLPGADVVTLARTGHCPHLESPLLAARAIVRPLC